MLKVVTGDLGIDAVPGKDRVLLLRMLPCCWRGMIVALTGSLALGALAMPHREVATPRG